MVFALQDCWTDNLKLVYDADSNTFSNVDGVTVEGMDFGGVEGVAYLDYIFDYPVPYTSVFGSLVTALKMVGYRSGVDLHGIPVGYWLLCLTYCKYDWRLPPDGHQQSTQDRMKSLIEATYNNNGKKRVHVVSHGLGVRTISVC